jgi:hypothetical protein
MNFFLKIRGDIRSSSKFNTGVKNTSGTNTRRKFTTGVIDTGGKYSIGVVDTGKSP